MAHHSTVAPIGTREKVSQIIFRKSKSNFSVATTQYQ